MITPMLKEAGRLRRDLPLIRARQRAPGIYGSAYFIDDGSGIVLLLFGRKPLALVEHKSRLSECSLTFLWLGYRRDELGVPPVFYNLLSGLANFIELPMPRRIFVRRIENWVVEKIVCHTLPGLNFQRDTRKSSPWLARHFAAVFRSDSIEARGFGFSITGRYQEPLFPLFEAANR